MSMDQVEQKEHKKVEIFDSLAWSVGAVGMTGSTGGATFVNEPILCIRQTSILAEFLKVLLQCRLLLLEEVQSTQSR